MILIEQNKTLNRYGMVLEAKRLEDLRRLGVQENTWVRGRQEGGGYFKLDVREYCDFRTMPWLSVVADTVRGMLPEFSGAPWEDHSPWDAYLLYYPAGSNVQEHLDPAPKEGYRHIRANVVVTAPTGGGELVISARSGCRERYYAIILGESEAVVFEPSDCYHQVSRVLSPRLVFSVGALVPSQR